MSEQERYQHPDHGPMRFPERIDLHVHRHDDDKTPEWVNRLIHLLANILQSQEKAMSAIDDLTAEVAKVKSVQASAVTLIKGIAAKLSEAGTDPAKLAALQADLDASTTELAQAVTDNTPADTTGAGGTGDATPTA